MPRTKMSFPRTVTIRIPEGKLGDECIDEMYAVRDELVTDHIRKERERDALSESQRDASDTD